MSFLSRLQLHHFRCYDTARLEDLARGLIVLTGPNGAGKTNVLEAVSMLSPGRGLRGVPALDIQRRDSTSPWTVFAEVDTGASLARLGTGLDTKTQRRTVHVNGMPAKSQSALSDYFACTWLTPQMDRLFIDGAGERRRFLDRLIFTFDPGHSGRSTRYENAMRQRSKILQEGGGDPAWLSSLEAQMAETGVAIAAARLDFIQRLQGACNRAGADEDRYFPKARITSGGTIEELLHHSPAVEVEELFAHQLHQSRDQDAQTGGAASGPHKSDLLVRYAGKDMPAAHCSTGEQKALLIGLILAHSRLMAAERGAPPVLLLDEIVAHLDESRRAALFGLLQELGGQVFMTGTDASLFSAAPHQTRFLRVEQARISTEKQGLAA